MKIFSLLIKPAGADCNLRCDYCFYLDHLKQQRQNPRMKDDLLEKLISSYMQTNQNNVYNFGWQGGEPTLMGLNFFQRVIELQKKYGQEGVIVQNGLQTNGTLLTDELAKFFSKYKFLLGVSLDGPDYLHNEYRKTIGGKNTHNSVMKGINRLKKNHVEFNILSLVNNLTIHHAKELYEYFKHEELFHQQYIPCVEFNANNQLNSFSITGDQWGTFLCEIFDEWIKEDVKKVSIRLFDSIIQHFMQGTYTSCHMMDNCCQYFVIEHDGNIYPCDFFVRNDLLLGNIKKVNWEKIVNSPSYQKFGAEKSRWSVTCSSCPYLSLCHGDCQKNRPAGLDNSKALSILCRGWRKFYTHALPRFKKILKELSDSQNLELFKPIRLKKIGRNEPCPCGSGRKYKNCCLK